MLKGDGLAWLPITLFFWPPFSMICARTCWIYLIYQMN